MDADEGSAPREDRFAAERGGTGRSRGRRLLLRQDPAGTDLHLGPRHRELRAVVPAGSCELFRLLSKRHLDLSNQRTRLVSRVHALAVELSPGGIAKELNSTDAAKFLATLTPTDPSPSCAPRCSLSWTPTSPGSKHRSSSPGDASATP